jgi:glycosyltransferase involved in cell wall biosynthesis
MKVIQVHNRYRYFGGEDAAANALVSLLTRRGIDVRVVDRSSSDIGADLAKRIATGAGSIYSPRERRQMSRLLENERPDIVHAHNLYPLLTPSILLACRDASVPVVMTLHNFRLTCPIGVHFVKGEICERCVGGREYACVQQNCRGDLAESSLYALRSYVARKLGLFRKYVSCFIAPSEFIKCRLVDAGFDEQRFVVLPNFVSVPEEPVRPSAGKYVGFVGRFSAEKGVTHLLSAAREIATIPVALAGDYSSLHGVRDELSANTTLLGELQRQQISAFYRNARFLVVPSTCYEVCPMVVLEAMSHGLPVIASRLGGIPELIKDGETGILFESQNTADLADKIRTLWSQPELCDRMGATARETVRQRYSEDVCYEKLHSIYADHIRSSGGHRF